MGYVGGKLAPWFDTTPNRKFLEAGAGAGGKRLRELAAMNTPIQTGHLRESWKEKAVVYVASAPPTGDPEARGGAETHVSYAEYIEHGWGLWGIFHRKYPITPKDPAGALHFFWPKAGGWVTVKKVMHPGSHGQHMMAIAVSIAEFEMTEIVALALEEWKVRVELQNPYARPGRPV